MGDQTQRILIADTALNQAAIVLSGIHNADFSRIAACTIEVHGTLSECFLTELDQLLKSAGCTLAEVNRFAVGVGPGSFTGIRVGCATLKTFAQVSQKPILPFSSLRAYALSAFLKEKPKGKVFLVSFLPAYQGQCFCGYGLAGDLSSWRERVLSLEEWLLLWKTTLREEVKSQGREPFFCGADQEWKTFEKVALRPDALEWAVREKIQSLKDPWLCYKDIKANYLKASQAEEKLAMKMVQENK